MSPAQQYVLANYRSVRRQGNPPLASARAVAHVATVQALLDPRNTILADRVRVATQWADMVLVRELERLTPRIVAVTA